MNEHPRGSAARQSVGILLAWVAFALFDAMKTFGVMKLEGMHHNWPVLFVIEALSWLPWALSSMFIVNVARRLRGTSWPLVVITHVVIGLCIAVLSSLWTTLLILEFHPFGPVSNPNFVPDAIGDFYDNLLSSVVLYACVLLVQAIFDARERLSLHDVEVAKLNEQLAQTRLNALRRQIEPHFLFNSLNAISGLIREGRDDAAIGMIVNLSDFLRRTLAESTVQEVTLFEEMEFVQHYLAIQKIRFAERLRLDVDIPAALHAAAVPNLILQPLVENAVDHGIAKRKDGGEVRITACTRDERLVINVADDGAGLSADWHGGKAGVGLSNVRTRLKTLYGERSSFDLYPRDGGGVEVAIAIPLRLLAT